MNKCVCDPQKGIYLHYRDSKGQVRCDGVRKSKKDSSVKEAK